MKLSRKFCVPENEGPLSLWSGCRASGVQPQRPWCQAGTGVGLARAASAYGGATRPVLRHLRCLSREHVLCCHLLINPLSSSPTQEASVKNPTQEQGVWGGRIPAGPQRWTRSSWDDVSLMGKTPGASEQTRQEGNPGWKTGCTRLKPEA